jgi:hypothetical protein
VTCPPEADRSTWVSVADEPLHRARFADERLRIYEAVIAPGEQTAFHRHDQDTLYAVLAGGRSSTEAFPGAYGGAYSFPRTIRWTWLLAWGITRAVFGWTDLPAGAWFVLPAHRQPATHRVRASTTNRSALRMLGVEILARQPTKSPRGGAAGKRGRPDYRDENMRVRELPPKGFVSLVTDGLIVVIAGDLAIAEDQFGAGRRELHAGEFLRLTAGAVVAILDQGHACRALLVESA